MRLLLIILTGLFLGCSKPATEPATPKDSGPDATVDGSSLSPHESAGCAAEESTYAAGTTEGSVDHDGRTRSFRVRVPSGYDSKTASALVLMFHGGGGSGRQIQQASAGMDDVADRENFITVYPDGTGVLKTWNGGGCCGAGVRNDVDDVGFVSTLLDHLEEHLCLDRRRVFASGMSNGGLMSHRLACDLSERIAAVAPVAGTNMTASCTPSRPVSVLQIHGTADGHVLWEGGEGCGIAGVSFASVPDTMQGWRTRNQCGATTSAYFASGDGSCEAAGCADETRVVLCSIEGGGHSWPGGAPAAGVLECPANGPQSTTFEASEVIWKFFSEVSLEWRR